MKKNRILESSIKRTLTKYENRETKFNNQKEEATIKAFAFKIFRHELHQFAQIGFIKIEFSRIWKFFYSSVFV